MSEFIKVKQRWVRWAAYASVTVAIVLVLIKLFGWWVTGSVGILASLLDSMIDIIASLMILVAVGISQTPPDQDHRFGHGKAEPLASLAQSVFIAGSALYIILYALERIWHTQPVREADLGIWIMVGSMLLTAGLILFQKWVVRKTRSTAIEADYLHYVTDLLANGVIIIGLILSAYQWLDPILGLLIGVWIGYQAIRLALSSSHQLLDKELSEEVRAQIRDTVLSHPDVAGFNDLRTFQSGATVVIQLDLELDDNLTLFKAHEITEEVTDLLNCQFECADITIHQEPASFRQDSSHHQWEMENSAIYNCPCARAYRLEKQERMGKRSKQARQLK